MKSLAKRIALKFSLVLASFILVLSLFLLTLLRQNVRRRESAELTAAAAQIGKLSLTGQDYSTMSLSDLQGIPYYLTYTVYNAATAQILATNDPFIPVLPLTEGKVARYTRKSYYSDGDLNVLYCARVFHPAGTIAVQTVLNMDQDTAEQLLEYVPGTLAFIFIPLLILSYAASFLIARQALRPVSRMTNSAEEISSSNLDTCLPVTHRGDELDILAAAFNTLFRRLKSDFDRERAFTANVSHELKTPLAVILGQANLIRRWGKNDQARLEKSVTSLITEAHSMQAIISNLLQLSRLETGMVKPVKENLVPAELYTRLVEDTRVWSPETVFAWNSPDNTIVVSADRELLYQAWTIIVSNSIKFSPEPACISITIEESMGWVKISFTDSGPGFLPEVIPHVFERFYRGDPAHARDCGGSGLGLSIAQQIMHVLGGTITAVSRAAPEHGAVITMRLRSIAAQYD
jgi:two-component system, OmpR family, sensor histidine kinase ArlS